VGYQLAYLEKYGLTHWRNWSGRWDSNPRLQPWQG